MHTQTRFLIRNFLLFVLPMLIPVLVLSLFSAFIISSIQANELQQRNQQLLQQTSGVIESAFSTVDLVASSFDANARNQQMLKGLLNHPRPIRYTKDDYLSESSLRSILSSAQNANPYVRSVYLYMSNPYGNYLPSTQSMTSLEQKSDDGWQSLYEQMPQERMYQLAPRVIREYDYNSGATPCISVIRQILTTSYTRDKTGAVILNVNRHMLDQTLSQLIPSERGALALYGQSGALLTSVGESIAAPDWAELEEMPPGTVFERELGGSVYACQLAESRLYSIHILSMVPRARYYQRTTEITASASLAIVLALALGLLISYSIARRNHRNLKRLLLTFEAAERGDPPPAPLRTTNEYEFILQNMLGAFVRQSQLKTQLAENKYQLRTTELSALQSQINPHFLYNTLRTIYYKAMGLTGETNDVSRMIESLSDIMYYAFSLPGPCVPLKREIQHAESYVNIQRIRHSDGFRVDWHVDKRLLSASVMKLLLQPLLENSISHGIVRAGRSDGLIRVSIRRARDQVVLIVKDNGAGIAPDALRKLSALLDLTDADAMPEHVEGVIQHIGLPNIRKRLALLYPSGCRMRVYSHESQGTMVVIRFPYMEFQEMASGGQLS